MSELFNYILEHEEPFQSKNRLASLYSDFTALRTNNPEGYAANVQAWRDALAHATRARKVPDGNVFTCRTGDKLDAALNGKGLGRPTALRTIAHDSVDAKQWYRLNDFLQRKQGIYYKPWVPVPAAEDVAIWCMKQLGLAKDVTREKDGDFVILSNVEEAADRVIAAQAALGSSPSSLIHSLDTFVAAFSRSLDDDEPLTLQEISILLAHLYRDKRVIDMTVNPKTGSTTIKFSATSGKQPDAIEEHDNTVAMLRTLTLSLNKQIEAARKRVNESQQAAREAVKAGNQKQRALAALRQKKLAETTLAKREASLDQIERTLTSIDDAVGQKEMVNAMEASGKVLADLNKEIGGVDRVDRVMDQLRDGMSDVDEINKVLGEAGAESVDEAEVDEELEAMMAESKPKEETQKQKQGEDAVPQFPDAPTSELSSKEKDEVRQAQQIMSRLSLAEASKD